MKCAQPNRQTSGISNLLLILWTKIMQFGLVLGGDKKHSKYSLAILNACLNWMPAWEECLFSESVKNWHWLSGSAYCETSSANSRFEHIFLRWNPYIQFFLVPFCVHQFVKHFCIDANLLRHTHDCYGNEKQAMTEIIVMVLKASQTNISFWIVHIISLSLPFRIWCEREKVVVPQRRS